MAQATSKEPQAQAGLRRRTGMGASVVVAARVMGALPLSRAPPAGEVLAYLRTGAGFGLKPSSVQ